MQITSFNPSRLIAAKRSLTECPHCGAFNRLPPSDDPGHHFCHRCDFRLYRQRSHWLRHALAYVLSGLLLFVISNLNPFLSVRMADQVMETTLLSGVQALLHRGEELLAALVFLTIFLLPLLELLVFSYLLLSRLNHRAWPGSSYLMSAICRLQHWNMLEVFLLAVLVATVKLSSIADVVPGPGLYCFLAVVLLLSGANVVMNRRALWEQIDGNDYFVTVSGETMRGCSSCGALVGSRLPRCPRCHLPVNGRIPHSLQKTWAYLLAAMVLYIPANTLPMMFTTSLGQVQSDTIFSGALYLLKTGQWPLALVVFVASIMVPIGKIIVLIYLLIRARRPTPVRLMHRARLYRLTELVGRWSMVDVYVVILLMALVQFGIIANVEPGGAALSFGGVVVLTMLAAESFDPRLLWDGVESDGTG